MTKIEKSSNHWIVDRLLCFSRSVFDFLCGNVITTISPRSCNNGSNFSAFGYIYRFFRRRDAKHTDGINEAYNELKNIRILEDDWHSVSIRIINKRIQDIPYLDEAIEHLKAYGEIYEMWNNLHQLEIQTNSSVEQIKQLLERIIKTRAAESIFYPNHEIVHEEPQAGPKNKDYYNMDLLVKDVFNILYQNKALDGRYYERNITHSHILTHEDQSIVVESSKESDGKTEKLLRLLNTLVSEEEPKRKVDCLRAKRTSLEDIVKNFCSRVDTLSQHLKLGESLRGKCKLGY